MPARRTGDCGPGLWDFEPTCSAEVPTPTASSGGPDHGKASPTGNNLRGAIAAMMVPTPTAQDYGSNRGGAAGRIGKPRPSLRQMLLTPTATANTSAPSMSKWAGGAAMQDMLLQIEHAGGGNGADSDRQGSSQPEGLRRYDGEELAAIERGFGLDWCDGPGALARHLRAADGVSAGLAAAGRGERKRIAAQLAKGRSAYGDAVALPVVEAVVAAMLAVHEELTHG